MKYLERSFSVASGFGEGTKEKGRFIWDKAQEKLVRAEDYVPPSEALSAPIMVDRFYEGLKSPDGVDIGSRGKYRDYLKATGLAPGSDFSQGWYENRRKEMAREEATQRKSDIIAAFKEQRERHG